MTLPIVSCSMRNFIFSSACFAFLARTWKRRCPFIHAP